MVNIGQKARRVLNARDSYSREKINENQVHLDYSLSRFNILAFGIWYSNEIQILWVNVRALHLNIDKRCIVWEKICGTINKAIIT